MAPQNVPLAAEALSKRTSAEHETLVKAVHALEGALASPAPGREEAWLAAARRELANVVGLLQEHCESANRPSGLIVVAESRIGRTREVSQARRQHEQLPREAMSLLSSIDEFSGEIALGPQEVRQRAAHLTKGLRAHQAREADILMLAFQQDIGVPD